MSKCEPPTKEVFYPANPYVAGGAAWANLSRHSGVLINADGNEGYTEGYIPLDFSSMIEIVVVFIARATLAPMTMRVLYDFAHVGETLAIHSGGIGAATINTTNNFIHELDITSDLAALDAGDYFGIVVTRFVGQDTNILLLGIRVRYR